MLHVKTEIIYLALDPALALLTDSDQQTETESGSVPLSG